jgi:hypothetical protein
MAGDSRTWTDVLADFGQQVTRRSLALWGPSFRDAIEVVAASPRLLTFAAEVQARTAQDARSFYITPQVSAEHRVVFHVDRVAACAGPAYCVIPDSKWAAQLPDADDQLPVIEVTKVDPNGPLEKQHLAIRVETNPQRSNPGGHRHLLSVSLVGLQTDPKFKLPPKAMREFQVFFRYHPIGGSPPETDERAGERHIWVVVHAKERRRDRA